MVLSSGVFVLACAGSDTQAPTKTDAAVYVATYGNDAASGVAPTAPVATIASGIQRALQCSPKPCEVRIAEGVYDGQLELADGVDLRGGWKDDFSEQDAALYRVRLTSEVSPTLLAADLVEPTLVEGMTIVGADVPESELGGSSYAVRVRDSKDALTFSECTIDAGVAADGADGQQGEIEQCSAAGGQGGAAFNCGGSVGGIGTAGDDPVSGGAGGLPGNSNCPNACPLIGTDGISNGKTGKKGGDGMGGQPGTIATDMAGAFVDGVWVAAAAEPGKRGQHGTGGGGGGSGGSKKFVVCFGCNSLIGGRGGDGGRGGCAGAGGEAGQAGGGSFGIVLLDSSVRLEKVIINAGPGGDGGKGGDGGIGEDGSTDGGMGIGGGNSQQCGLLGYNSGGGGLGGHGGRGGDGGGGGGGIGGVSISLALVGASSWADVGGNVLNFGPAGKGGLGGLGAADASEGMGGVKMAVASY